MAVEIRVPPLGESLVDAIVGQWLKSEGEEVSRGETVLQLETDKVNLDVTAPEDGVLSHIEKREGAVVTVGELLGVVGLNGASAGTTAAPAATAPPAASQGATGETPAAPPALQPPVTIAPPPFAATAPAPTVEQPAEADD